MACAVACRGPVVVSDHMEMEAGPVDADTSRTPAVSEVKRAGKSRTAFCHDGSIQ